MQILLIVYIIIDTIFLLLKSQDLLYFPNKFFLSFWGLYVDLIYKIKLKLQFELLNYAYNLKFYSSIVDSFGVMDGNCIRMKVSCASQRMLTIFIQRAQFYRRVQIKGFIIYLYVLYNT